MLSPALSCGTLLMRITLHDGRQVECMQPCTGNVGPSSSTWLEAMMLDDPRVRLGRHLHRLALSLHLLRRMV